MANECLAAIHLCRVRATRLTSAGVPAAGPLNAYVTDKPLTLEVTPVTVAGEERDVVGGCDCLVAAYKGRNKLKRFDLSFDLAVLEPGLIAMLTGADTILDATDIIGAWWSDDAWDCSIDPPLVAIEAWQTAWDESIESATFSGVHWVWPATTWQIGPNTLENNFLAPRLLGESRRNVNIGTGPPSYAWPEEPKPLGGFYYDETAQPAGSCGPVTVALV